eukprot:10618548-Ditylum_brightwellii.AAC.1
MDSIWTGTLLTTRIGKDPGGHLQHFPASTTMCLPEWSRVILQHQKGFHSYQYDSWHMGHCMDLWEKGNYVTLVEDTIKVNQHQQPSGQCNKFPDHICWV